MTKSLFFHSLAKFSLGVFITLLLIFLPAGTLDFLNGWLFVIVLFVPMFFAGIVMMCKKPSLLERRLRMMEKDKKQKFVILLSGIMFCSGFVLAGFGFRFGWYVLPFGVSLVGVAVFLAGYILFARVLYENEYASRSIEVDKEQKLVDTGLYSVVRHPMYASSIIMFLSMPVILGSLYSLMVFLVYPFIIAVRIKNEEAFLEDNLDKYSQYKKRVKYRIIPYLW